jgi:hypothetical protein
MGWKSDIAAWAKRNNKDPERVSNIAMRKGWDPNRYTASMQKQLFDYLDKWYTLSVKVLPTPATALRRNPVDLSDPIEIVELQSGWTIWVIPEGDKYTTIASNGKKRIEFSNNRYHKACKLGEQLATSLR